MAEDFGTRQTHAENVSLGRLQDLVEASQVACQRREVDEELVKAQTLHGTVHARFVLNHIKDA